MTEIRPVLAVLDMGLRSVFALTATAERIGSSFILIATQPSTGMQRGSELMRDCRNIATVIAKRCGIIAICPANA
jgi:hypothetical protein